MNISDGDYGIPNACYTYHNNTMEVSPLLKMMKIQSISNSVLNFFNSDSSNNDHYDEPDQTLLMSIWKD